MVGTPAFVEGWGLYAERLADEMGLYTSELDRLGMLQARMSRASRLMVDTGLHAFDWPRQKAIDFVVGLHIGSAKVIASEVDRYIITPGQATAYLIGAQEIEALRRDLEVRQKNGFDIRRFHDAVLEDGALSLPMLRDKISKMK